MTHDVKHPATLGRLIWSIIDTAEANNQSMITAIADEVLGYLSDMRSDDMNIVLSMKDCYKEAAMLAVALKSAVSFREAGYDQSDRQSAWSFVDNWRMQIFRAFDYSQLPGSTSLMLETI